MAIIFDENLLCEHINRVEEISYATKKLLFTIETEMDIICSFKEALEEELYKWPNSGKQQFIEKLLQFAYMEQERIYRRRDHLMRNLDLTLQLKAAYNQFVSFYLH